MFQVLHKIRSCPQSQLGRLGNMSVRRLMTQAARFRLNSSSSPTSITTRYCARHWKRAFSNAEGKAVQDSITKIEKSSQKLGFFARMKDQYTKLKPRLHFYAVAGGSILGCYMVITAGYGVIDFFASISFYDVGTVAFLAGIFTGFALGGVGFVGSRAISLRPEPVYKLALKRILAFPQIKQELGAIKPGSFRAYSYVPGAIRFRAEPGVEYSGWNRYWRPKKVQIMFQVKGEKGHGMVGAEVERDYTGQHYFNVLAVTNLETGERHVLEGDADTIIYKGELKLR